MSVTLPTSLRNLTRKQILVGGSVAVPVLAIGLGLLAAPKLDERPPMEPVSQERMQILVAANSAPAAPPPVVAGSRLEVLPPGAAAAAAPPRPIQAAYRAPAAADYGRDVYGVTREDRLPVIRPDPPSEPQERAPRMRDEDRYQDMDEPPPPEEDEAPPSEAPDEEY